jgi:branched-chain amino acid transport system permease protein
VLTRPGLKTSYLQESELLPSGTQKVAMGLFVAVLFLMPFNLPVINQIPFVRFLGDGDWMRPVSTTLVFLIAALGLHLLAGLAGQVSLGHAFFMGVGAYTGAVLGGEATSTVWGLGLPIWIWLPGAGLGAALVGIMVAPVAVRLRGLYLAIVTLGLVFIGIHLGNTDLGRKAAGDPSLGRDFPTFDVRIWKEADPLIDMSNDGRWLWFDVSAANKVYFFLLVLTIVFMLVALNLGRTRTGRAFQAIRDRDVAAEVMGVPEFKYKTMAFATSSFIAGIAGVCFASLNGKVPATVWSLFLSVEIIAILLIGGIGTVLGTVLGSVFVVLGPPLIEQWTEWLSGQQDSSGLIGTAADAILTSGSGDRGAVATGSQSPGWPLNIFDWNVAIFGLLIVVFLIFEPLGLYGIWLRVKTYWKRWPFSY